MDAIICEVCGEPEAQWDGNLHEVDMVMCANEHYYHDRCALISLEDDPAQLALDARIELIGNETDADLAEIVMELREHMPITSCPICQFEHIPDDYLLMFVIMSMGSTRNNTEERFRSRFKDHYDFMRWRTENYGKYSRHTNRPSSD